MCVCVHIQSFMRLLRSSDSFLLAPELAQGIVGNQVCGQGERRRFRSTAGQHTSGLLYSLLVPLLALLNIQSILSYIEGELPLRCCDFLSFFQLHASLFPSSAPSHLSPLSWCRSICKAPTHPPFSMISAE